jgi:hypothetical protein
MNRSHRLLRAAALCLTSMVLGPQTLAAQLKLACRRLVELGGRRCRRRARLVLLERRPHRSRRIVDELQARRQ